VRYEEIPPISREAAEAVFVRDDPHEVVNALLGLAISDPDWRWVQQQCLRFIHHPDPNVRYIVPLCFMHLARLHGALDVDLVFPVLEALQKDTSPGVVSQATRCLAEVKWYLFGIQVCPISFQPQELAAELAVLKTLECVMAILESLHPPLTKSIPANMSAERQLALFREAFEMMRQDLALLQIGEPEMSVDDPEPDRPSNGRN
jgi:hypothetical protein